MCQGKLTRFWMKFPNNLEYQHIGKLSPGLKRVGWEIQKPKGTMFVWGKIPDQFLDMGSVEYLSDVPEPFEPCDFDTDGDCDIDDIDALIGEIAAGNALYAFKLSK